MLLQGLGVYSSDVLLGKGVIVMETEILETKFVISSSVYPASVFKKLKTCSSI